jgi:hypothetical protein
LCLGSSVGTGDGSTHIKPNHSDEVHE